jgi:hypothetical protein
LWITLTVIKQGEDRSHRRESYTRYIVGPVLLGNQGFTKRDGRAVGHHVRGDEVGVELVRRHLRWAAKGRWPTETERVDLREQEAKLRVGHVFAKTVSETARLGSNTGSDPVPVPVPVAVASLT